MGLGVSGGNSVLIIIDGSNPSAAINLNAGEAINALGGITIIGPIVVSHDIGKLNYAARKHTAQVNAIRAGDSRGSIIPDRQVIKIGRAAIDILQINPAAAVIQDLGLAEDSRAAESAGG